MVLYNVDSQTAAHIHDGTLLTSGGVLYALPVGNFVDFAATLSAIEYDKMRAGGTYINVHTTANGGGECSSCITASCVHHTYSVLNVSLWRYCVVLQARSAAKSRSATSWARRT